MPTEEEKPAPYWKCVLAALPDLLVALQFLVAGVYRKPFPGTDRQWLYAMMQMEFLVIHSMAFLGFVALWKPVDRAAARARAAIFWGLAALYGAMALKFGWNHLAIFAGLTVSTYLGLFLNWRSPSAQLQLGVRWLLGTVIFVAAIIACGAPKRVNAWANSSAVLYAGTLYFFALAAVELSGFHLRYIPPRAQRLIAWLRTGKRR